MITLFRHKVDHVDATEIPMVPKNLKERIVPTRQRKDIQRSIQTKLMPESGLLMRLERLRKTLRPTPNVQLAAESMQLFAKLEYTNPVGSIKDRPAYRI